MVILELPFTVVLKERIQTTSLEPGSIFKGEK